MERGRDRRRCSAMPHIVSEAIACAEYDAPTRTLFVRFTSGEWYAYLDVAAEVYAQLTQAPSKGRFFRDAVRDRYAYRRLDVSP